MTPGRFICEVEWVARAFAQNYFFAIWVGRKLDEQLDERLAGHGACTMLEVQLALMYLEMNGRVGRRRDGRWYIPSEVR
jgi:hypothetical protein